MRARSYQLLHAPVGADSMAAWVRRYLEAQARAQISATTRTAQRNDLGIFYEWCGLRSLETPGEVTQAVLERFQQHLFYLRKANGQPLSAARQHNVVSHMQQFFRWLTKQGHLPADPASALELPKVPRGRLPQALTLEEVERVLGVLNLGDPYELRDRALLEVMYSTGIRRAELRGVSIYDIDHERGTLFVRQGKGRRDRVVPIGARALAWVHKYQDEVRPHLAIDPRQTVLFLNRLGGPLSLEGLSAKVREYFERAGIEKAGSCHLLRHTMATLMLEHGADIRYIQEMLGHASLDTTQIYTHVSIDKLKQIHTATHPGAGLARGIADSDASKE